MSCTREQAPVLVREGADAESAFLPGAADHGPGDEALGTGGVVRSSLEEGAAERIERLQHRGRQQHSRHGIGREGVQDGVDEDDPTPRREKDSTPARGSDPLR